MLWTCSEVWIFGEMLIAAFGRTQGSVVEMSLFSYNSSFPARVKGNVVSGHNRLLTGNSTKTRGELMQRI